MFTAIASPFAPRDDIAQACAMFDQALAEDAAADEHAWCAQVLGAVARKRKAEFLAGRRCARRALAQCAPELVDVPIGIGVGRAPRWPSGIVGAITHAQTFAAAAVARTGALRGIGIDSQPVPSAVVASEIARLVGPGDVARVQDALDLDAATSLAVVFSAKESVYKCVYPLYRAFIDFLDAEITTVDPAAQRCRVALVKPPDGGQALLLDVDVVLAGSLVHTRTVLRSADLAS